MTYKMTIMLAFTSFCVNWVVDLVANTGTMVPRQRTDARDHCLYILDYLLLDINTRANSK